MSGLKLSAENATDITAISQLVVCERESRDMCFWERMARCFHDDSLIDIRWFRGTGNEFVEASKDMYARGMHVKHRLGPVLVSLNGQRAIAIVSGIIDIPVTLDGVEVTLSSHALLMYRAEKREGAWGLMSFEPIYRRDEVVPSTPGGVVHIPAEELTKYRAPYRHCPG